MNAWQWASIAISSYLGGWYITPFLMVASDLRFPERKNRGDMKAIRSTARETAQAAPYFALAWPLVWLALIIYVSGHVHQGRLEKMIAKPRPDEEAALRAEKKRQDAIRVAQLERENKIGQAQ